MLYGFLLTFYVITCLFLVLLVLIQKGKSSLGVGRLGAGAQVMFGGGGGQDIFQKITWILVAIYLLGALGLSLMKTRQRHSFKYATTQKAAPKPLTDTTPLPEKAAQ